MVTLPCRTMFRRRNSMPEHLNPRSAAISTICSTTKFICGEPNPRIAPSTTLLVYTPNVSQCTFATHTGPQHCTVERHVTQGVTEQYAPPSATMRHRTAVIRPVAVTPMPVVTRYGWRL